MKTKGLKIMETLVIVFAVAIGGSIGCAVTALLTSNSKAQMHKEYGDIIQGLKSEIVDLSSEIIDINKELELKDNLINQQEKTIESLEEEIDILIKELKETNETPTEANPKERLPLAITNTIRGMDYRKITNKKSDQYALQKNCYSNEIGIRMYDKYYCTALGSAYGRDIGDTWHVTLECGTEFDIIYAEYKDDGTDPNFFGHPDKNYDKENCINVLEFVMDVDFVSREVMLAGTFTKLDIFGGLYGHGGNIVKMEYTGRVWSR